jgi:phosphoglycolate phosphatase-like HAD superfamily hydrolase
MIRAVAFDFDGTLVRSNAIKRQSFYDVTAEIAGAGAALDEIFADGFDGDRHQLFDLLSGRLAPASKSAAREEGRRLVSAYSERCHQQILVCEEVPGAREALTALSESGIAAFIVSATPERDLQAIVVARGLGDLVKGILGRPVEKPQHLSHILESEDLDPSELAMVGDGDDDLAAARSVGCHFIAITGTGNPAPPEADVMLDDLHCLPEVMHSRN